MVAQPSVRICKKKEDVSMKKVLSIVLILVLLLTLVPFGAVSVSADIGDHPMSEYESNNTIGLADRIYNDYTVSGRCGYNDIDYFKLVVSTSSKIDVILVGDNSHLLMALCDSTGDAITAVQTSYSSSGSYGAVLSRNVSAGTYYIGLVNQTGYTNGYAFYVTVTPTSTHTHTYS